MPGPEASSDRSPDSSKRWMCSHLVRLLFLGEPELAETALLEEIGPQVARVAVETPYPTGSIVKITADGFEVRSRVVMSAPRENDFCLDLQFDEGTRWSPELWQPDHLYLLSSASKKKRRAFGASG